MVAPFRACPRLPAAVKLLQCADARLRLAASQASAEHCLAAR